MPKSQEIIQVGSTKVQFLLEGKDTNNQLCMFEFTVPVGGAMPLTHYHKDFDETAYVIEGCINFLLDGAYIDVPAGESIFIPKGAVHAFYNKTNEPAKALATITPALIGPDFFRESGEVVNAGGPPDLVKLSAVFAKHGLVAVIPNK